MGTKANIHVEKPEGIYYADVATTGMTATGTLGSTVTTTGWTDTGFVDPEGKVKLTFGGNAIDVRPLGMEGNLSRFVNQKTLRVEFMGLEDVVASLDLAMNATLARNEIPDGGDAESTYKALAIIFKRYIVWIKKAAPAAEFVHENVDTEVKKIPFVFDAFVEEAADAGERQWKIMERTAA
jgi:hypothetical protein